MKHKTIDKEKLVKPLIKSLVELQSKLNKELEQCVKTLETIKKVKDDSNKRMG